MTVLDECDHGSDPNTCPVCLGPAPKPPPPEYECTYRARFDGQCPTCNLPIVIGQMVSRWSDERWRHVECTP